MVDKEQNIFVMSNNTIQNLGSGFSSKKEIEEEIENRFDMHPPGEYTYGLFDEIDSVFVEDKYPIKKEYTTADYEKFKNIEQNADKNSKVINYFEHRSIGKYPITASIYRQNIRYYDGEVDFSLKLDNNLFDNVPISTLDTNVENKIKCIFKEVVGNNGIYLGYKSSYASRGGRDPYVRIYGRLKRDSDKDKELRKLYSLDYIKGIFWTTENITPIPIYKPHDNSTDGRDVDVIAVTKYVDSEDDSYDRISNDILDNVKEHCDYIEQNYNLRITEIGKTAYNKEFMTVYIGVKFAE